MAASSITKNFVVEGAEQVEMFANAIEESYQESLKPKPKSNLKIIHVRGEEAKEFMERLADLYA